LYLDYHIYLAHYLAHYLIISFGYPNQQLRYLSIFAEPECYQVN